MEIKSIEFTPLGTTIVCRVLQCQKTEAGIFLPENAKESDEVYVAAVNGACLKLKRGDKVLIRSNSTCQRLKLGNEEFLVFEEKDILGIYA